MKSVLIISTGGTIASAPTDRGLQPSLDGDKIIAYTPDIHKTAKITAKTIFTLDSSNIQPEEWKLLAQMIRDELEHYDGIVVLHGTDTMAYTASMLSFILRNPGKPIVLTGSQKPIIDPETDGIQNIKDAVLTAVQPVSGVFITFNGSVILGSRAVKVRTLSHNAFESVNAPLVGTLNNGILLLDSRYLWNGRGEGNTFTYDDSLDPSVFLLKLIPGTQPELLDALRNIGYKGLVVESFGLGGVHELRRNIAEKLKELAQSGMAVVVVTQCLYETSDLSIYGVGREMADDRGILSGRDMTSEAAVTKLMWVLGHTSNFSEIRRRMSTNYCGEIAPEEEPG